MFALVYGVILVSAAVWPGLDRYGETSLLVALGIACLVNFGRNRTFHCALTAPLFLVAAGLAALAEAGLWEFDFRILWGLVLAGVGAALLLEWRTVGPSSHRS